MATRATREDETKRTTGNGALRFVFRFIVAAIVLLITSFLVRGFQVKGFWTALIAALFISGIDYIIELIFNFDASPFGRGLSGFIVSAAIIYFTQFFISNMTVTLWGAIIGALIIGIADALLPTRFM
ncbi:MAG: phage holin family protein [Firmicutes bacterium]|nr:phage holin family protein [Bacillota bacterium]